MPLVWPKSLFPRDVRTEKESGRISASFPVLYQGETACVGCQPSEGSCLLCVPVRWEIICPYYFPRWKCLVCVTHLIYKLQGFALTSLEVSGLSRLLSFLRASLREARPRSTSQARSLSAARRSHDGATFVVCGTMWTMHGIRGDWASTS
jgi:hypothetical protein